MADYTLGFTGVQIDAALAAAPKARILVNTNTTTAIRESANVASVTDVGVGRTTVTFANAFATKDYTTCPGGEFDRYTSTRAYVASKSAAADQLNTQNLAGTLSDTAAIGATFFGDLA